MRILIFGTGGHAKSIAEAIQAEGVHHIVGLINEDGKPADFLPGIPVVGSNTTAVETAIRLHADAAVIALGDGTVRRELVASLGGKLSFPCIIHPAAWVSPSSRIEEGTVVLAGGIVGASTRIGKHCIINTNASVDHDCIVGDFTHICPGSTVAGHCMIGNNVWLGAGATVVDRVHIPHHAFIKAGSIVIEPRNVQQMHDAASFFRDTQDTTTVK